MTHDELNSMEGIHDRFLEGIESIREEWVKAHAKWGKRLELLEWICRIRKGYDLRPWVNAKNAMNLTALLLWLVSWKWMLLMSAVNLLTTLGFLKAEQLKRRAKEKIAAHVQNVIGVDFSYDVIMGILLKQNGSAR